jgi:histidinol-phosphate/aromatic aminotransferase/cobyric acid decarboxylase-like protein
MTFKDKLPPNQRVLPLLDPEVERFANNFLKENFKVNCSYDEKIEELKLLQDELIYYLAPIIDLQQFPFFYQINGITDGLNQLAMEYKNKTIKIIPGDYEWMKICRQNTDTSNGDVLYITNPHAGSGNYFNDEEWNNILDTNSNIALDCAYIGSTPIKPIKINKNVNYVYVGLSKMFGLPSLRAGFVFCKRPSLPLDAFLRIAYYNFNSVSLTRALIKEFDLDYIHNKYKKEQAEICKMGNVTPADVVYFATTTNPEYDFYKRGNVNRLCITSYFKK